MAGIVVAAALLSGLSLINSYQPAIAQQNMTSNATTTTNSTTTGGGSANATTGNTTTATNATTSAVGGGNQSTSEVREHIEAACMSAQNGDTQGVLMQLNLALNELGGNMTTAAGEDDGEDSGEEDSGEGGG